MAVGLTGSDNEQVTGQEPEVVRSPPARVVQQRVLQLVAIALIVVIACWLHPKDLGLLIFALGPAAVFISSFRPPTEVSIGGIRRPWRRPARLSWDEVVAVRKPALGDTTTTVLHTDGRPLRLPGIPSSAAERVAQIGGKPVRPAAAPGARTADHVPTAAEQDRDRELRLARIRHTQGVLDAKRPELDARPPAPKAKSAADPGQA